MRGSRVEHRTTPRKLRYCLSYVLTREKEQKPRAARGGPCSYGVGAARGETLGITSSNYVDMIVLLEKGGGGGV